MHREPIFDEPDFQRFVDTYEPLMRPGRDSMWVLAGRTDSNLPKLRAILDDKRMKYDVFYLCYNTMKFNAEEPHVC